MSAAAADAVPSIHRPRIRRTWCEAHERYVADHWRQQSIVQMAQHLGRSPHGVALKLNLMRLQRSGLQAVSETSRPVAAVYALPMAPDVGCGTDAYGRYGQYQRYDGAELRPYEGRPGALHAYALPSRAGQRLYWPDGRITALDGGAQP